MELSFLLAALRRRPWLVIPFMLLGLLPGVLARFNQKTIFGSTSVLLVSPPSIGAGGSNVSDVERYVSNQIAVLKTLNDRVAEQITNPPVTSGQVFDMVDFKHKGGTDVVEIAVKGVDPALVQLIARTYANVYIDDLRTRSVGAQANEIKQLEDRLAQIKAQQLQVDNAFSAKLNLPGVVNRSDLQLDAIDPVLATQRRQLAEEYSQALANKNQLEQNSKLKITSEIVQQAPTPRLIPQTQSKVVLIAGAMAGAMLGLVAAVLAARLSATLLDHVHAEEILGMPVPHSLEYVPSLHRQPSSAVTALPVRWIAPTDHLCVRAESGASVGETLTIAVCGSERGAGATTVALAMAGRFAGQGSRVVLIDTDTRDANISHIFETPINGGVDRLVVDRHVGMSELLVDSPIEGLRVLGLGGRKSQLRRDEVPILVSAAQHEADVVIIDAGPVLESASALQLTQLVDAVVLAVPGRYQRVDSLEVVARQLKSPRVMLLPVLTEPKRPRMFVLPTFRKKTPPSYAMPIVRENRKSNGRGGAAVEVVHPGSSRPAPANGRRVETVAVDDEAPAESAVRSSYLEQDDLDALRRSSLRRFRD